MIPLYKVPKVVKFIETESRMVVMRGLQEREKGVVNFMCKLDGLGAQIFS